MVVLGKIPESARGILNRGHVPGHVYVGTSSVGSVVVRVFASVFVLEATESETVLQIVPRNEFCESSLIACCLPLIETV